MLKTYFVVGRAQLGVVLEVSMTDGMQQTDQVKRSSILARTCNKQKAASLGMRRRRKWRMAPEGLATTLAYKRPGALQPLGTD